MIYIIAWHKPHVYLCDLWLCLPPTSVQNRMRMCDLHLFSFVCGCGCVYVGGGLPHCVVLISSCLHACRVTPLPGNTWPQHTSWRALHLPHWSILYTHTVPNTALHAWMCDSQFGLDGDDNHDWMTECIWCPLQNIKKVSNVKKTALQQKQNAPQVSK